MRIRDLSFHPDDFTATESHQINALFKKLGKACDGKPADVVGVALQAMIADVMLACSEDAGELSKGVDAFANDVKGMISDLLAKSTSVH